MTEFWVNIIVELQIPTDGGAEDIPLTLALYCWCTDPGLPDDLRPGGDPGHDPEFEIKKVYIIENNDGIMRRHKLPPGLSKVIARELDPRELPAIEVAWQEIGRP